MEKELVNENLRESKSKNKEKKQKKRKREEQLDNQSQEQEECDTLEQEECEKRQQVEREREEQEEIDRSLLTITQGSNNYHRSRVEKRAYLRLWGEDNGFDRSQHVNISNEVNDLGYENDNSKKKKRNHLKNRVSQANLDLESDSNNAGTENDEHLPLPDLSFGSMNYNSSDKNKINSTYSRQERETENRDDQAAFSGFESENAELIQFLNEADESHNDNQTYVPRLTSTRMSRRQEFETTNSQLTAETQNLSNALRKEVENQDNTVQDEQLDQAEGLQDNQGYTVEDDQLDQEEEVQKKRSKSIIRYFISFKLAINESSGNVSYI